MEHMGWLSLVPPILAVILAILTKNVIISLFLGAFVGVLIIVGGNPLTATTETIGNFLFPQLTDSYNAAVLVLLFFIGGFVALIEKSGGGAALAAKTVKSINSKVKAQLSAWLGGLIIFFSDLGTPLIVGPIFEKIFDKARISREKLAYIIDSTSSPVAVLIPFIGWGVYIMGLIRSEFDALGITTSEFDTFVQVIPFQFYAISAVLMIPLMAVFKLDFGPMAKAERRVRETGELYWKDSKPLRRPDKEADSNQEGKAILIWLPLLVLFVTLFGLLSTKGFPFEPVDGNDFRVSLTTAYLFAAITIFILLISFRLKKFAEIFDIYTSGMQKMVYVAATLVLAWSLGTVISEMGTANYIVELMQGRVPAFIIPALLFVIGAIVSLASGSSWGTFAIMLPIAIPMAVALDAQVLVCIGAVLSGGIFGDHSSPISDTSILSSTGAGADHIDHVKTQFPYALTNAIIAIIGFVIAGVTGSPWTVVLTIVLLVLAAFVLSKLTKNKYESKMNI
ncbi:MULTISPECIES: Na+/H+ antiporter NhaC family protein [Oceanobacillus]|uniref:Na+/H+ antiporter NhaC family protein n=1 Tax=Oceanobacillus aidingensis TaxID=645964 RepID=A0ABV9K305_9BACI|nr:Na+/H+ antiporter NhaC family protein [Oceanobacillus oncorhynchi]MDM8099710.1 Na+/H+ antiporter NhaC family protein [Oceanobacillus oncorhynchi]